MPEEKQQVDVKAGLLKRNLSRCRAWFQGVVGRLKVLSQQRPILFWMVAALLLIALIAAGASIYGTASSNRKKEAALQQLAREQRRRADANKQKPVAGDQADLSDLQFKDVSNGAFARPTCDRLENRKAIVITNGCDYRLRAFGDVSMAVVFMYEQPGYEASYNQLKNNNPSDPSSLYYFNTYMKSQAARYGVGDPAKLSMTFYGPYPVVRPARHLFFRDNHTPLLDIFRETSQNNQVPEGNYDLVHYVFLDDVYGGVAFSGLHRAFTEGRYTVQTFVHETLHLFGAGDKYNNNDCNTIGTNDPFGRYEGTVPGHDVMCSQFDLNVSKINDITAREIGWAN